MKMFLDMFFDGRGAARFFGSGSAVRRQQALEWLEILHADDMPEDQMIAYVEWMEADPRNATEFRRMDRAWIASDAARDEIRARIATPVSQGVQSGTPSSAWPIFGSGFGLAPQMATACAVLLIAVFVFTRPNGSPETQYFATATGEQRVVALSDGTEVSLNTASELTTDFSPSLRSVRLVKGQAYFNVASNPDRPFVVHLDEGNVEVVGTVFDVFKKQDGFSVTVLEGRVAVSPNEESAPDGNIKTLILKQNERTEVSRQSTVLSAQPIDAKAAAAWQTGQLIFRATPLSDVLIELGRYSEQEIRVTDANVASLEFTGVLTLEDAGLMTNRLAALLSLQTHVSDTGDIVISRVSD